MSDTDTKKPSDTEYVRSAMWDHYHGMRNNDLRVTTVASKIPDKQKAIAYVAGLKQVCDTILLNRVYFISLKDDSTYKVDMRLKLHRYPCLGTGWSYTCPNCGSEPHYIENKKSCKTCKSVIIGISEDMIKWADHQERMRG